MKALLLFLALLPSGAAARDAAPDSLAPLERPVPHRSSAEEALALPGYLLYLPLRAALWTAGRTASAIWEERLIDRLEAWLTTADGRAGIRPLASTQVGTGARLFYKDLRGADADLTSSWGLAGRQHHVLALATEARLHCEVRFRREPAESFFGTGQQPRKDDRLAFQHEQVRARLRWRRALASPLSVEAHLAYEYTDIERARSTRAPDIHTRYAPGQLPGLKGAAQSLQSSLLLRASALDIPASPVRGQRGLLRLAWHQSLGGEPLSHLQLAARLEQFFELFYRRSLALGAGAEWRWAPGRGRTPFYELASLGGNEILRGFRRGRFRDRGAAFAALTYKYPVWKRLDAQVFAEAGRTFATPEALSLYHWRRVWGGGLRLYVPGSLAFEQLVAFSGEEWRLVFDLKSDF